MKKYRALLIWSVVDLEVEIDFDAKNLTELRKMANKVDGGKKTPVPFYCIGDKKKYRTIAAIPEKYWRIGDTHHSIPYIREMQDLETGKVIPVGRYTEIK